MAITVHVQILIVSAEATDQPKLPTHEPPHFQSIRVLELPRRGEPVWMLSVSKRLIRQEAHWETQLSTDESQHLITLLEEAPHQSMSLEDEISFDGTVYEVMIMRADHNRFFRWRNDDWQYTSNSHKGIWARVAAIVDHVMKVVERTRPANG